jgi:hypothetical protein
VIRGRGEAFRVEPGERRLLRDGTPIPLTPKAFDLLLVLVESPGRLLEKDTLMKRVWQDAFVEEANLANNISLFSGCSSSQRAARPSSFNSWPDRHPIWSPDGNAVAFASGRSKAPGIYGKRTTGEQPEDLLVATDGNRVP